MSLSDRNFPKKECSTFEWTTKGVKNETNTLTFTDYPLMNSLVLFFKKQRVLERGKANKQSNHKNCIAATVYLPWTQRSRWWTNVTSHISHFTEMQRSKANECTHAYTRTGFFAWRMTFTRHNRKWMRTKQSKHWLLISPYISSFVIACMQCTLHSITRQ